MKSDCILTHALSLRAIWPYGRGYRNNDGNVSHHWWYCIKLQKFMLSDDIIIGINDKSIPDDERYIKMDYVDIFKLEIDYLHIVSRVDILEICLSRGENNFEIEFCKILDCFPELKKQYYIYETKALYKNAISWCEKNNIPYINDAPNEYGSL